MLTSGFSFNLNREGLEGSDWVPGTESREEIREALLSGERLPGGLCGCWWERGCGGFRLSTCRVRGGKRARLGIRSSVWTPVPVREERTIGWEPPVGWRARLGAGEVHDCK